MRFAKGIAPEARADLLERFADQCYLTDMREQALDALKEELAIHRAGTMSSSKGTRCAGARRCSAAPAVVSRRGRSRSRPCDCSSWRRRTESSRRAYAELTEIALHFDDADAAADWGTRAIALAERVGDAEALVLALNCLGAVEFGRGQPEGREKLERAIEMGRAAGLADESGHAYVNLAAAFHRQRDWAMVDRYVALPSTTVASTVLRCSSATWSQAKPNRSLPGDAGMRPPRPPRRSSRARHSRSSRRATRRYWCSPWSGHAEAIPAAGRC